jgi:vacuolar iron transporter family protein
MMPEPSIRAEILVQTAGVDIFLFAYLLAKSALMPLVMVLVSPTSSLVPIVSAASLGFLALLGAVGRRAGGANVLRATARVTFWGALAMALTAGIGAIFGTVV